MTRRRPLHDVELVDDDGPDAAVRGSDEPVVGRVRRRGRRPLVVGAAVLTVVAVGAVAGQSVVDARERERIAAVAALPGAIDPLTGPPTVLWEPAGDVLYRGSDARTADGALITVRHASEGPVRVASLDPRTGDPVWEVELIDGTTRLDPGPGSQVDAFSGRCLAHPAGERLAVCWVHDGMRAGVGEEYSEVPASVTRLVLLDTADGSVVTDLTDGLDGPGTLRDLSVTGNLVVVSVVQDDGSTEVRAATATGSPAWQLTVPAEDARWGAYTTTVGDLVALVTDTELRLLDAAGDTVRTVPLGARRVLPSTGAQLYLDASERIRTSTVVRPEADTDVEGYVVIPALDDGSVPGLVLTYVPGDGLVARDGEGDEMWSAAAWAGSGAMVLDGRVHAHSGSELVTLDARTGAVLWRSAAVLALPVTDGRHLVAATAIADADGRRDVVALDPADGSELWRGPLPDGADDVTAHLRLLVAVDHDGDGEGTALYTALG